MSAGDLGALLYEPETLWGEDVTTFATHRIPHQGALDLTGLKQDKIDPQRIVQYLQGGSQHIPGIQGGSFKTRTHLAGHGSAPSGAVTADAIETFLAYVIGKLTPTAAAGTTLTGGTKAIPTTTASGTFAPGALGAVGALGDGDGNGQVYAVNTHTTNSLTLLTELDDTPANGAVLYSGNNIHTVESARDAAASITGLRFLALTANLRYEMHGCYAQGWTLGGLGHGETPFLETDWGVSWWRPSEAGAFPSSVTSNQYNPSPNAAGSMFFNDVGTATRAKLDYRSLSIGITAGVVPLMGPGGANQYQTIVGARRVPTPIEVNWTEDIDSAATAAPAVEARWKAGTAKHMLVTLNAIAGTRIAFYFPNLCITGPRPVQQVTDRLNRIATKAMAYTGPDTTSELSLSAFRMYCG